MNKQELIKRIKDLPFSYIWNEPYLNKEVVLETIKHLDKPEKVVIPQFVADYIEWTKEEDYHLLGAMGTIMTSRRKNLYEWFYDDDNIELFARAWLDGYEVEEEKRYTVKITKTDQYLHSRDNDFFFVTYVRPDDNPHNCHTRKELEEADFGWVFDCPGTEIQEVE